MELSIKQEAALEHERCVKKAAMEVARDRVLDVLLVIERQLARVRWNCQAGHDGNHRMNIDVVEEGGAAVEMILESLPEIVEINYQQLVASVYDEDEQPLENEEYVIDEVRNYVKQLLGNLKVKP